MGKKQDQALKQKFQMLDNQISDLYSASTTQASIIKDHRRDINSLQEERSRASITDKDLLVLHREACKDTQWGGWDLFKAFLFTGMWVGLLAIYREHALLFWLCIALLAFAIIHALFVVPINTHRYKWIDSEMQRRGLWK